jgi:hypothetical protein
VDARRRSQPPVNGGTVIDAAGATVDAGDGRGAYAFLVELMRRR